MRRRCPLKTIIIDSGRSRVKALCGTEPRIDFPAVVAPGHEFSMPVQNTHPLDAMHIEIDAGPDCRGEFFVGELAVRQSRAATQARERDKTNLNNLVLVATAASIYTRGQGEELRLAVNLPARDWARQKNALAATLRRRYRVHHRRGFLAGLIHDFVVAEVYPLPEGAAAYFGAVYDLHGRVRNPGLAEGTCLVVDVGDTTANYVWMADQDYIDEYCGSLDLGMHRANAQILTWLQAEYAGIELTLPELETLLRRPPENRTYRYGTQEIPLIGWQEQAYSGLAARLASELQARLPATPNHVLLVGGGGLALADHLRGRWPRSRVIYDAEEALWLNAMGMAVMLKLQGLLSDAA